MKYSYKKSVKSDVSDELINTYLIRPAAGIVVRLLYNTPATPNQVTLLSAASGLIAAFLFFKGGREGLFAAGLFIALKDILDSADGQLARAKSMCSRYGRFLDSIVDFFVDLAVFFCIGLMLYRSGEDWISIVMAFLCFTGTTLRISYHVFYQVHYLHLFGRYLNNRIDEAVRKDDIKKKGGELGLQRLYQVIYGWQDGMMDRIDVWCRAGKSGDKFLNKWYKDGNGLRISGLLGMGMEMFILTICSLLNSIRPYLYLNVFLMNTVLVVSVIYRRFFLSGQSDRGRIR
jgi:phosphatidylglycerophosphate synthase